MNLGFYTKKFKTEKMIDDWCHQKGFRARQQYFARAIEGWTSSEERLETTGEPSIRGRHLSDHNNNNNNNNHDEDEDCRCGWTTEKHRFG